MKADFLSRPLGRALLVSVALHLLLLLGFDRAETMHPAAVPGLLQVLVGQRPAAPVPVPAAEAPHVRPQPARPLAVPQDSAPRAVPASAKPAAEAAAPPGAAAEAPVGTSATLGTVAERPPEGLDADGLRQYRIDLATATRRFRAYPAIARSRGWEGTVELAVQSGPIMPVPSVRVTRSSGHAVLDEQALNMLAQAVRGVPLPESLRGRDLNIAVPIRFSLDD